jgi:plasmid stabilization system protein ParE
MKVVLSAEASDRLEDQVRYIASSGAPAAADRLRLRVLDFLENHLALFPRTGKHIPGRELWETWIPGTRLVVWYRIDDGELLVVTVWHAAQDRSPAAAREG